MSRLIILISLGIFFSCELSSDKRQNDFFEKGTLSTHPQKDSAVIRFYSQSLLELNEHPLKDSPGEMDEVRLIVAHPFYNLYIIRVARRDNSTSVVFKLAGDKGLERSAVSSLALRYASASGRIKVLSDSLFDRVDRYSFYNAMDDSVGYTVADGISYLLESRYKGRYQAVLGKQLDVQYKGSVELYNVVDAMHKFVPNDFIPDLQRAQTADDLVFPVLRNRQLH